MLELRRGESQTDGEIKNNPGNVNRKEKIGELPSKFSCLRKNKLLRKFQNFLPKKSLKFFEEITLNIDRLKPASQEIFLLVKVSDLR